MVTYRNPVYGAYFADPFVLRHEGTYFAYGTAPFEGRTLPALRSSNLVDWEPLGDVLEPLESPESWYWAPEVAFRDGRFHMYYSAGAEEGEGQRLRRAVAEKPEGPFRTIGDLVDSDEPFSIDAHPFQDDDGRWYLFYCKDFLEGERVGTGIVVDRLDEPDRVGGDKRTVVRPFADWNLFAAQRAWYGRTWDWYTVEGPFVLKRDGRYYCFFSGGAWREPNYGVSYAIAEHPLGPWEVPELERPTILQTVPDLVLGPGHASIVQSPSGEEDWIVYHAWQTDRAARLMRIDRLEWTPDGPRCDGPSVEPRPCPA
ncbi:MAG: glycoside hydrolase family 43 protein [Actinomycetota bacterium]|nr:glycoside hydrolase family 43 protein [Actinomycetota bacterium]